jgi:hypothetical protein
MVISRSDAVESVAGGGGGFLIAQVVGQNPVDDVLVLNARSNSDGPAALTADFNVPQGTLS